jgi:hypothetical protein
MRHEPRPGDDLVDRIDLQPRAASVTLDPETVSFGDSGSAAGETDSAANEPEHRSAASAAPPDSATRIRRRARRLTLVTVAQVAALAGAFASMALPWYKVQVSATQLLLHDGRLVTIGATQVQASGFDVVLNGSTSPHCPATPLMWGLPVPLAFATVTVVLAVIAVVLRSIIAASAGVVTALQAVRHLGMLHDSVVGGPEGCLIGELSTAIGRPLFLITLTTVVTLSALTLLQLWLLRSTERKAKIAAGESVPPTLVAMLQSRIVGVAAAVVAEAQRR